MPTAEEVTKLILDYSNDGERFYAVALVGEWGSGKTRYVETQLKEALEGRGLNLVRVSMFGLSSVEELFERLLEAVVRFPSGKESSSVMRRDAVADGVKGFLSHLFEGSGISYQASAKFAASFLCGNETIIVLDDVERLNPALNQVELFGAINNLVENQGSKVVFIANSAEAINAEIREKLVWRIVSFEPDMNEVVQSVFGDVVVSCQFGDAHELLTLAACDSGCRNVRAMIKSKPLVAMVLASPVVSEGPYANENVRHALRELFAFAFGAAMGKVPEEPMRDAVDVGDDKWVQWMHDKMKYEHFCDAEVIGGFFDPNRIVTQDDVDASIDEYMRKRYHESGTELEMKMALNQLIGCTKEDDEVVIPKIERLSRSIRKCEFDSYDLVSALELNDYLFGLGFEEAVSPEEALSCAKEVIDADVACAYVRFHDRYKEWGDDLWRDCETLKRADAYCVSRYEKAVLGNSGNQLNFDDPNCGVVLVERLRTMWDKDPSSFLDVATADIARCFVCGNAKSQVSIFEFVKTMGTVRWGDPERKAEVVAWMERLANDFAGIELCSKLGPVRKRWVMEAIESVVEVHR